MNSNKNTSFGALFKKYRLRSEIETLAEFGNLLADEGIVYETSLFTRWQRGERVPKERKILLKLLKVFINRNAIQTIPEVNLLLETAGQGYLTVSEQKEFPNLHTEENYKLIQASLGGLLKDYRTQKNITLKSITYSLGWQDETRMIDIEQGKEKPSRELIDEISNILHLKEPETNYLLLIGNYLPTQEEINKVRNSVSEIINNWQYPAVLLDYTWRILFINLKNIKFFNFSEKEYKELFDKMPNVIEILFHAHYLDTNILTLNEKKQWESLLLDILVHFRYAQQNRTNERWYIDLISKCMDNPLFRIMWKESQNRQLYTVTKHGKKLLINPFDNKKRINLYFSVVPLLNDPRFEIEFCYPSDIESFLFFSK